MIYQMMRIPAEGVVVERRGDDRHCNVYHVKCHSEEIEWGYAGSGPADLALSIMHAALPPTRSPEAQRRAFEDGEIPPAHLHRDLQGWSDPLGPNGVLVSQLAQRLYQDFKFDFVAQLPEPGGRISREAIERWINDRLLVAEARSQAAANS